MAALVEKKLHDEEESLLKLHMGQKTIIVREQIDKAVKVITFVNIFVSSVVASDSHASLAVSRFGCSSRLPSQSILLLFLLSQYTSNVLF
jgi:hypothetical protein